MIWNVTKLVSRKNKPMMMHFSYFQSRIVIIRPKFSYIPFFKLTGNIHQHPSYYSLHAIKPCLAYSTEHHSRIICHNFRHTFHIWYGSAEILTVLKVSENTSGPHHMLKATTTGDVPTPYCLLSRCRVPSGLLSMDVYAALPGLMDACYCRGLDKSHRFRLMK